MGLILRDINMSISKDIEALIGELTPEQIKSLMKEVKKPSVRVIDTSHRERRMAITNLYFSVEPKPHTFDGSWKEYDGHRDSIREQVLSGVDL